MNSFEEVLNFFSTETWNLVINVWLFFKLDVGEQPQTQDILLYTSQYDWLLKAGYCLALSNCLGKLFWVGDGFQMIMFVVSSWSLHIRTVEVDSVILYLLCRDLGLSDALSVCLSVF